MIILSYGMPRSASTFCWQLTREILEEGGFRQEEIKKKYLPLELQTDYQTFPPAKILDFAASIPNEEMYIIKTHSLMDDAMKELINNGKAKATVSIRHPLDIMVSLLDIAEEERRLEKSKQRFTKIESLEIAINWTKWHITVASKWLEMSNLLEVSYGAITNHTLETANKIQTYLNLEVDVEPICSRFLQNKENIIEFRGGGFNKWTERFSDEEIKGALELFAPFIKRHFSD